ncbi:MAG: hypothetical protein ABIH46_12195 [Chloroflexota bacterium]
MPESAERRPLVSVMRIIDDTLQEVGLPGPFDVIPTPSEVIHFLGIPTLDDLGESLKARASADLSRKGPPKLPFM